MNECFFKSFILLILLFSSPSSANKLEWIWEEQLQPTLEEASSPSNLSILGGMLGASLIARPFDPAINDYRDNEGSLLVGRNEADDIRLYTHGPLQIGIALTQLFIDTENGLAHTRALILGSVSHNLLAEVFNRERPDGSNKRSYPSGHNTASFATAASLSYAYGLKAAIPAYTGATLVALSSLKQDRHWASDIVGGAILGTFWAKASYEAKDDTEVVIMPSMMGDGAMVSLFITWP